MDSPLRCCGDQVARPGSTASDIIAAAIENENAVVEIWHGSRPGEVCPDPVAPDKVIVAPDQTPVA